MDTNPLSGIVLKLNRAERHLHEFKDLMNAYLRSDFYETTTERNSRRRLTARAKNVREPDPELSVVIGDCVFNYRSALDQLAYALATGHTNPLPDQFARSSAFPIYNRQAKFAERW